jgi:hypothetical protein
VISNCVINLSTNKEAVFRESFRVLNPGGRFAVSDVVIRGSLPQAVRVNMDLWTSCIGGALEEQEYATKLRAVGFTGVHLEPWRICQLDKIVSDDLVSEIDGQIVSTFIRANKPKGGTYRGPRCREA